MNDQVSSAWGDPNKVQQFRTQALQQGMGIKQVDDYVAQMQQAYQTQSAHNTTQTVLQQTAGGVSPDQALKDPIATQKFIQGGGKVVDPITNMTKSVINGDMTLGDIGDPIQKSQVDAQIRSQGLDPNRLPKDPQTRAIKGALQGILDQYQNLSDLEKSPAGGAISKLPWNQANTYNKIRGGLSASLSQFLGPGKGNGLRISQPEIAGWAELLPQPGNTQAQNAKLIQSLDTKMRSSTGVGLDDDYLKSFGVSRSDKGKYASTAPAKTPQGGVMDFLGKTASNIPGDTKNVLNGILNIPATIAHDTKFTGQSLNPLQNIINPSGVQMVAPQTAANAVQGYTQNLNKDAGQPLQGGDVLGRMGQNFQQRPVSTVTDLLSLLGGAKALAGKSAPIPDETPPTPNVKTPGALQQILRPQAAKNAGSAIRDNAIADAVKSGKTISGDDILAGLHKWADKAKPGNITEHAKIDEALANAEQIFTGKKFSPQDVVSSYHSADSGFTQNGVQKTATQALVDRGVREVLGDHLNKVTDGAWNKGTGVIAKSFKTDKSTVGKVGRNLPGNIAKTAIQMTGAGALLHMIGL